jgi:hypothetical protein
LKHVELTVVMNHSFKLVVNLDLAVNVDSFP